MKPRMLVLLALGILASSAVAGSPGNRSKHLDDPCDPFYVGLEAPKLVTPQWADDGVELAFVLSIDDMQDPAKYEKFLAPIAERLKQIDGRAPISIFTTKIDPGDGRLQTLLKQGMSIEVHTLNHQHPLLQGGDLPKAKSMHDQCVDLLASIPGNRPVAFRMPYCDSMNSLSPRFFTEIFNKTTEKGHFLGMDSSVFVVFTADDPSLSRELVQDADGRPRFAKYIPVERQYAGYVENYPYPYVVDKLCWEVPAALPSDWQAGDLNQAKSPKSIADWKAAIDAAAIKQGVFTLCFHPHNWIDSAQVVELADYAAGKYGKKVKFYTLREINDLLTKNFLGGTPLRNERGEDNGVRVWDIDGDGYMDAAIANAQTRATRIWKPGERRWAQGPAVEPLAPRDFAQFLETEPRAVRLLDLDLDGVSEAIVGNEKENRVLRSISGKWQPLPFRLPEGVSFVDIRGNNAGCRFVDLDEDGRLDVVFSNHQRYSLHLWKSMEEGWSRKILAADRSEANVIPPFIRADGANNGAWFKHRHLWVQNEDTGEEIALSRGRKTFLATESRSYSFLLGKEMESASPIAPKSQ